MNKIVKVLSVVDTREYEEGPDDKFHPIPGSGAEHECARCGRLHEVHAEVLLDDGTTRTVGTTCAGAETTDIQSKLRTGAAAAKRLRVLEAERAKLLALAAEWDRVRAEVEALPLPEVTGRTGERAIGSRETFPIWTMGDAEVWDVGGWDNKAPALTDERRDCLVERWRENRGADRGLTYAHRYARYHLRYTEEALAKVRARIAESNK